MNCDLQTFLDMVDRGERLDALKAATGLRESRVYGLIRKYRPDRPRQSRRPTSDKPAAVRGLAAEPHNIPPTRIAFLLGVTPAYVYKILGPRGRD
jgi:hypothetical protein